MISNRRPPLTPLAQEALDALASAVPNDGELTYEDAYDDLAQEEDLNQPAVEDIIERLYVEGHL